jgi:two-component system chemotaxis response regulator CheY
MKSQRVLIAAGSTFMRIMLETALKKLGFEVVGTVKEGMEAVAIYRQLQPDIVLVDASLSGTDGIEVTRIISNENPSAVVIMLIDESTAKSNIIVDAVRAGASGYMRKPISAEEIKSSIQTAMMKAKK